MRLGEILVVAAVAIGIVLIRSPRVRRGLPSLIVVGSIAIQVLFEGPRWQLWPAWVAGAVVVVIDLLPPRPTSAPGASGLVISTVVGLVALAPLALLPIPDPADPDGPHAVGTQVFELTDEDRAEPYGAADGPRRIMVQAWFPTEQSGEQATWADEVSYRGVPLARYLGLPDWFLGHARYTTTAALVDTSPIDGSLPIVVYSHGWRGFRTVAVDQAERLASHGFLVLAPDHTYGAIATRFDDGTVVEWDPAALPPAEEVGAAANQAASELLVATYAGDLALILDAVADGRLGEVSAAADLDTVGVYGHSTGGGAVVRFCLEDDRCDAVLGHDAWVEPLPDGLRSAALAVPGLFQRSDGWRGTPNDELLRALAETAPSVVWQGIVGAEHFDFTVMPAFSPVASWLGLKGPIPADRVVPIVSDHLLAFMDQHLRGGDGSVEPSWEPGDLESETLGG